MYNITFTQESQNKLISEYKSPINDLVENNIIDDPISNTIRNTQRNILLERGRVNFSDDKEEITSEQLVDLYCFYYLPMHLVSTYCLLLKEQELLIDLIATHDVFFIDVGCGPMTSGIAFNQWVTRKCTNRNSINYIGIDSAQVMLSKAQRSYESDNFSFIYDRALFFESLQEAVNIVAEERQENALPRLVILNFCYVFGSDSLIVSQMNEFTDDIRDVSEKVLILFQNPRSSEVNRKWADYKKNLTGFKELANYPTILAYQYADFLNSANYTVPRFTGLFEAIKNF